MANLKNKQEDVSTIENGTQQYELRPPDGGWGYAVVLATIIMFVCTNIPMYPFGLIFGNYLKTIGDETTGTTLSNGMFNTAYSFTGLIANGVLNRFPYRLVGIAGAVIFFMGACGVVFFKNLFQLIIFFGLVQGLGFGLMMPACYSAMNSYFVEKMALVMSIAQAVIIIGSVLVPQVAKWSMETFEFRGTLVGLAVLALICVPTMILLQPVERHMKKVPIEVSNINAPVVPDENNPQRKKSLLSDIVKVQLEPLINQERHMTTSQRSLNTHMMHAKPRRSIISLGDRVASVSTINVFKDKDDKQGEEELSIWKSFMKSMDMSLFKEPKYLNISFGLAFCATADMAFISIIPLMLGNVGFNTEQTAMLVTVYFGSDLTARILLTVISGIIKLNSRLLVLFAAIFSAIFRVVLVSNDAYMFKMCVLAALGFLRCFIQTPLPLVISEEYPDKFSTAFSLFLAVNGVISLTFGLLMSFIKSYTQSDVMACHSLTVAFSICIIAWIIEMTVFRKKSRREQNK